VETSVDSQTAALVNDGDCRALTMNFSTAENALQYTLGSTVVITTQATITAVLTILVKNKMVFMLFFTEQFVLLCV
jgi:hypothetical protein